MLNPHASFQASEWLSAARALPDLQPL